MAKADAIKVTDADGSVRFVDPWHFHREKKQGRQKKRPNDRERKRTQVVHRRLDGEMDRALERDSE